MAKKIGIKKEKLTENVTYHIEDSTIYLLLNNNTILSDELNILYKKLMILIEDQNISYINISGKHLEQNKKFFLDLGFTLSYYDVNKLNKLYAGSKDKKAYRCYGIMTKKDLINKIKEEKIGDSPKNIKIIESDSGYISNLLLLFGGIALLCYFCVTGAIYLVK